MVFCKKCGRELTSTDTFCPQCGIKQGEETESAKEHLRQAGEHVASVVQEFSKTPQVGIKVAAGLHLLGLILFFFPWAGLFGFSVSGFSIATHPGSFGALTIILLAIPAACLWALYQFYCFYQGQSDAVQVKRFLRGSAALALAVQMLVYLIEGHKLRGLDVFTGWFYLEFLVWAGILGVFFWEAKRVKENREE